MLNHNASTGTEVSARALSTGTLRSRKPQCSCLSALRAFAKETPSGAISQVVSFSPALWDSLNPYAERPDNQLIILVGVGWGGVGWETGEWILSKLLKC